jgi:hypothetical protein
MAWRQRNEIVIFGGMAMLVGMLSASIWAWRGGVAWQ